MNDGITKNVHFLESQDVLIMKHVLQTVFPEATNNEDMGLWDWGSINVRYQNRMAIFAEMKAYQDADDTLFRKWTFDDLESRTMLNKLASWIQSIRKSVATRKEKETKLKHK